MNIKLIFILSFLVMNCAWSQDTIRLERKPKAILKSWYPEFKEFPKLKIGENKILFTLIPDFERSTLRDHDINLIATNGQVLIKETEKLNQFLVLVNDVDEKYIEVEIWFELENKIILLEQNGQWLNINQIYPNKENRVMLQKIKLKITR